MDYQRMHFIQMHLLVVKKGVKRLEKRLIWLGKG